MQQNKLKKYLTDIIETIDAIFSITKDLKYADMEKIGTRWALERGISIIGEAIYQANKMEENLPITDIKKIATARYQISLLTVFKNVIYEGLTMTLRRLNVLLC